MSQAVLQARDLRKRYGELVAVDGVSLIVSPGETYGLLGPNGAGKTTTVSMICGLLDPDDGDVSISGRPMTTPAVKGLIGYVPQEVALYPDLTATENLRFFGRLYGLGGGDLAERISGALRTVGLTERADDRVDTYSGGMQRRLNIAAGLLHDPNLLVLDEPTVGVDPQSRSAILDNVERLAAGGTAVLYTTHYMEEAERLCDRVGIIDNGRIIAEGTRRELVAQIGQLDRVEIGATGQLEAFATEAKQIAAVNDASSSDDGVQLLVEGARHVLPKLLEAADRTGVSITSVDVVEPDLEAVFLHLTGRALRD